MKVDKILFPTDFSDRAEQALDQAIFFAREYGAELHMLHVTVLLENDPHNPAFHFPDHGELYDRVRDLCNSDMAKLAGRHPHDDITIVQTQRRNPSAANGILDYAKEHDIDLIVMATEGRRGLKRVLLGSVAGKVVQLAPCPVVTVRATEPPRKVECIEKVLAPVDFSEPSQRAVEVAVQVAMRHKATLHLLHVVEDFSKMPVFYRPILQAGEDELGLEAEKQLKKLVRDHKHLNCVVAHGHGKPADEIARYANDQGADLLVIATRGLTGLQRVLIGSTAERVVSLAGCPVLTVKDRADLEQADPGEDEADGN